MTQFQDETYHQILLGTIKNSFIQKVLYKLDCFIIWPHLDTEKLCQTGKEQ